MNHYQKEKVEFESNFIKYKNKRIVLYGIGRFTATLVPMLNDWNIVGLMDKNPEKIGTYVYGLPIIGLSEIESRADVIIINTSGTYWDLIYQRIKNVNLPVYFRNGEKAEDITFQEKTEYWDSSYEQLKSNIDNHDIVSFDFFDTLFIRKLYVDSEIWEYVADEIDNPEIKKQYLHLRKSVYINISDAVPDIYEIYKNIYSNSSKINIDTLLNKEFELENKFIEPRYVMLSLMKYAIESGKEVYVISDMYLPIDFFRKKFEEYNIHFPKDHIWVSCEYNCTKRRGDLWERFKSGVIKGKTALHIGDNVEADIDNCIKYSKSDTYFIMSKNEMLNKSSIKGCLELACNDYHNIILGLCTSKLFNDPFGLCKTQGQVVINSRKVFGYCIFGPIIFSFIYWMLKKVEVDAVKHLCFLGRDGFFLKQNYEYMIQLLNIKNQINISYVETSRQILMCANIENENDFSEYIKMPYEGKLCDFLWDRLRIEVYNKEFTQDREKNISMPQDYEKVQESLFFHEKEIRDYIKLTKKIYKSYLESYNFEEKAAIVDLGFYGTPQHYLSKLMKKEFIGYYIVANNSDSNPLSREHILKSCTNITADKSCKSSYVHSMGLAIESFLTSPHGMIKGMNHSGFIYSPSTNNQIFFGDKLEINEGVQLFISDMIKFHYKRLDDLNICIDNFIDKWYGILLKNSKFTEDVKRSFYNDNAFIHRRQERIFE